ncbi:MAG: cyclic nucleotide-binding domain-containing protein [Anaerolineaceae bacterium]|nr:MAG: cyclic nucleotide-binding domain-containing protein [Anaerolineaceae bacterium]
MPTIPERIAFLNKIHLFSGLSDDDVKDVAEALVMEPFKNGDTIIKQGTRGETFYILYHGFVKVVRQEGKREQALANLVPQDFFGEEELFTKGARSASIVATSDGSVLALHHSKLNELLKHAPKLKPNFEVVVATHRLWRRLHFKWVRADEVVYFLARKHPIVLWRSLILPAFSLFVPGLVAAWGWFASATWIFALAFLFLLVIAGWVVWEVVDWGNDYYVVTNQRVVWVEKVVGIFDSRQESPLSTILSVGVETDMLGRILDYGHVIVRTFVGKIPFNYVSHPYHASRLVEEYWGRTKERNLSSEKEAMKTALRKRLNLPTPDETPAQPESQKFSKIRRPSVFKLFLANLFKLRLEDGDTITYRKHGFVLWQQIWLPTMILAVLFSWWVGRIISLLLNPDPLNPLIGWQEEKFVVDSLVLAIPVLSIPFHLWWLYQYVDWTNDIFMVTPDQIIDIDKKPLGTEERRAATLENILSTESERVGLLGNIFNFGTVYITVGGSKLEFQDVYDPTSVQSDIDRRRMARAAAKAASQAALERERMAEWLATYHINSEQFRREQEEQTNTNTEETE